MTLKHFGYASLFACAALLAGCDDDGGGKGGDPTDGATIELATGLSGNGGKLVVDLGEKDIQPASWQTATSSNHWLQVEADPAANTLTLEFAENLWQNGRTATVSLEGADYAASLTVEQEPLPFDKDRTYKLPVVFRVLYNDASNENQYVKEGHFQTVIEGVNQLYAANGLPIEFVMATEDEEGKMLEEPGVSREQTPLAEISPEQFMTGKNSYGLTLWDRQKVINVLVYTFTADQQNVIGISQFPITLEPYDQYEGITVCPADGNPYDFPYPLCVCLNNTYIYERQQEGGDYNDKDIVVTLAHELGHFLALYHAFNESESNPKLDTDYCTDTKPYNRDQYMTKLMSSLGQDEPKGKIGPVGGAKYEKNVMRQNSQVPENFRSTNIMDYMVSDADEFTAQQKERVLYCLYHSFFLPGPKDFSESPLYQQAAAATKATTPAAQWAKPNVAICKP